jgi:hypothetical protein
VSNLKILIVGSEIRTELGLVASLKLLGAEVVAYLHIGKRFRKQKLKVITDQGSVKVNYSESKNM